MARMRMVKPDMRRSLTVSSWPIPVRWTFVGLLGYLDDHGRGLDELRLIKAELYPLDDDMTTRKIDQHLAVIVDRGPLCRYQVDGNSYLHITTWTEHQKVSHATDSRVPPCPIHDKRGNDSGTIPEQLPRDSGTVLPRVRAGARGSGNREQGKDQGEDIATVEPSRQRPRDELWDAIVEACQVDASSLTKTQASLIGKVRRELADVDATPGQVVVRAKRWRQRYREAELTPSALVKHWGSLATDAPVRAEGSVRNSAAWQAGMI